MLQQVFKWWHHITEPHCPICSAEKVCDSCETLKDELLAVRAENRKLLDTICELANPKPRILNGNEGVPAPVARGPIPWHLKRQQLEAQDRMKAEEMRAHDLARQEAEKLEKEAKSKHSETIMTESQVDQLEKELGVGDYASQ